MVQSVHDVEVRCPCQAAFVSTALLVGQHRDQNVVRMDPGVFDVSCVCQAAEDVFRVVLGIAYWEDLGGGGGGGGSCGGVE